MMPDLTPVALDKTSCDEHDRDVLDEKHADDSEREPRPFSDPEKQGCCAVELSVSRLPCEEPVSSDF